MLSGFFPYHIVLSGTKPRQSHHIQSFFIPEHNLKPSTNLVYWIISVSEKATLLVLSCKS